MAEQPERELVRQAQLGDQTAFEKLVLRYRGLVENHAFRLIGDRHWAEDIAQEVFLRLFQRLGHIKPDPTIKPWLLTVTTNLCISLHRRWGKVVELPLDATLEDQGAAVSLNQQMGDGITSSMEQASSVKVDVQRALLHLPPEERAIVVLSEVHGFTEQEVARMLSLSGRQVRYRKEKAIKSLRRLLADHGREV